MAEKAVIIGLFGGLLVSAGLLWAKMPPRPEIHYSSVRQQAAEGSSKDVTTGSAPIRDIPIDKPKPVELPQWAEHHPIPQPELRDPPQYQPKEVMPDTQDQRNIQDQRTETRLRQVPLPKRRPVGAVNRPHCICRAVVRRPVYVLPQANGGML